MNVKKPIASFLIVTLLSNVFMPTISWALTSGPTAPEATSFEPVDTTDLVNLNSGDFAYNIPILDVPGPSGGYPLSLSYHAGIQPNEDASWVGLGWTLNPGAINRSESGFPDDQKNVAGTTRTFWEGGVSKSMSLGVNFGMAGSSSLSAGLSYSQDTYRGTNQSSYVNMGSVGITNSTSSSNGHTTSSTGITVGIGGGAAGGINLSYTGKGVDASYTNAQANNLTGMISGFQSMDVSLATAKDLVLSRVGIQAQSLNSKNGNITTKGYNFAVEIPTPWNFTVSLGKSYQRYWIDETETAFITGSLYAPLTKLTGTQINTMAFDSYDLPVVSDPENPRIDNSEKYAGGTYADYDQYSVSAQGLGGTMRPFHYKSNLYRQTKKDNDGNILTRSLAVMDNPKGQFRFEGDFSNRYDFNNTNLNVNSASSTSPLTFNVSNPVTALTGESGTDGYVSAKNQLASSKHVEWYTNNQLVTTTDSEGQPLPPQSDAAILDGFIDCTAAGFIRDANDQIGGFKIINENGITYHYALPVYSYDEYSYTGRIDNKGKEFFNHYKKVTPYAYTWLLTAVTGPDFVDRNANGLADQGDWGYWTTFEYGKWTRQFGWRNPSEGYRKDVDQTFDSFSKGKKEIYYLNFIKSNTHTAVFVKELRPDGKGTTSLYPEAVRTGGYHDEGGFDPINGIIFPVSTLRLSEIYLFKNEDFVWDLPSRSTTYNQGLNLYHLGSNVVDVYDIADVKNAMRSASLKSTVFESDYTLCGQTSNSFVSPLDVLNTSQTADATTKRRGKLTLKAVRTLGKGGADLLPATTFGYDVESPVIPSFKVLQRSGADGGYTIDAQVGSVVTGFDKFKLNDVVRFFQVGYPDYQTDKEYCALIIGKTESILTLQMIGDKPERVPPGTRLQLTKNPLYVKNFYDLWGMFKSDFVDGEGLRTSWNPVVGLPENAARMTTPASATSVDVWSLREITNPLGAKTKINYESDTYGNALKSLTDLEIKSIEVHNADLQQLKITFYNDISGLSLTSGTMLPIATLFRRHGTPAAPNKVQCGGADLYDTYVWTELDAQPNNPSATFVSKIGNSIIVSDGSLYTELTKPNQEQLYIDKTTYESKHSGPNTLPYYFDPSVLVSGQLMLPNALLSNYGGGVRVQSIRLETNEFARETLYTYDNGVTSYEPLGFKLPVRLIPTDFPSCIKEKETHYVEQYTSANYYKNVIGKFLDVFAASRELPSPGVLYEKVTVKEKNYDYATSLEQELPGYTEYEFEVFTPDLVEVNNSVLASPVGTYVNPPTTLDGMLTENIGTDNAGIDDFSSRMGNLKRTTLFNGAGKKISETRNEYLHDGISNTVLRDRIATGFKNQGVIKETFVDARFIKGTQARYSLLGVVSQKIKYPNIQTAVVQENFKTGITTRTENKKFDFYSGQVTQTLTDDGYGNYFLSETVPAYKYYAGMGLSILSGKNMLTQEASSATFKVTSQADLTKVALVNAAAQTWSDQIMVQEAGAPQNGIWRQQASYSFVGDDSHPLLSGLFDIQFYSPYSAWLNNSTVTSGWQKNNEITLYDFYSHSLEGKDLNGNYAASKMSLDQTRVFATVSNARYNEFAFSGAEEVPVNGTFGGNVLFKGEGFTSTVHTGTRAVIANPSLPATKTGFQYTFDAKARIYHVSVWSNKADANIKYKLNNVEQTAVVANRTNKAGAWYLLEADISLPNANSIDVWCEANSSVTYFDDFRIHPQTSAMTSYVYNAWGEVTHILNTNNLFTEYQYDGMGKLTGVFSESFKEGRTKTSETIYHYANKN